MPEPRRLSRRLRLLEAGVHGSREDEDAVPGRAARARGLDGAGPRGLSRAAVRGGAAEGAGKVGCRREALGRRERPAPGRAGWRRPAWADERGAGEGRAMLRHRSEDDGERARARGARAAAGRGTEGPRVAARSCGSEILRKASACFAMAELDRRPKPRSPSLLRADLRFVDERAGAGSGPGDRFPGERAVHGDEPIRRLLPIAPRGVPCPRRVPPQSHLGLGPRPARW